MSVDVVAGDPLAQDSARGFYRRALDDLGTTAGRHQLRARLLLGLGEAQRRSGDAVGARQAFLDAARHARSVGDADLLGQAALGYGLGAGGLHRAMRCDLQHIALLEEAMTALGAVENPLRVRLLARLAEELYFTPEDAARAALSAEAVAMARRLGDRSVLIHALHARELGHVGPDVPLQERVDDAAELIALAEELGDLEGQYLGHMLRELALVESGRLAEAAPELDAAEAVASTLEVPSLLSWVLAARARQHWVAGRFAEAEAANGAAMVLAAEHGGDPEVANLTLGGQLLSMQLLRGDLRPFLGALTDYAQAYPYLPILKTFLTFLLADSGELGAARKSFDELAAHHFSDIVRTAEWSGSMWASGRTAFLLQDRPAAVSIYAELHGASGRWFADWVSTCQGPVDTVLGLLASLCQPPAVADRHFEAAMAQAVAAPSPPWLADAQHCYAQILLVREPRAPRALALLDQALRTSEDFGIELLAQRIRALQAQA